jgi:hypothetical protein
MVHVQEVRVTAKLPAIVDQDWAQTPTSRLCELQPKAATPPVIRVRFEYRF